MHKAMPLFVILLALFQFNSLLKHLRNQLKMDLGSEFLPPVWETQMKLCALASAWSSFDSCVILWGSESLDEDPSFTLSLSQFSHSDDSFSDALSSKYYFLKMKFKIYSYPSLPESVNSCLSLLCHFASDHFTKTRHTA